jgi:F420-non-reducing hydrogenase small subunit
MSKPKFAMYWSGSCGGCEIAVINIHEKILDVDANFDIAFWPVALDAKVKDVEALEDGEILLTLWNGSIRNEENEHIAHLLRKKSKLLVAFGSCAVEGSIPGLANLSSTDEIFKVAYHTISTDNPENIHPQPMTKVPEGEITIPVLKDRIYTLDQVVDVDYYMPGCPPESHQIAGVIDLVIQVVEGKAELPPKGAVIGAGNSTVCDECTRKRNEKMITVFKRIQEVAPVDPELCLLEQCVPCNGPATRSGCDARCPSVGAQCIGCYGPAEGVIDYGARLIAAFASVIEATDEEEIERILDGIPDPTGQFYRFNLADSVFRAGSPAFKKNGK